MESAIPTHLRKEGTGPRRGYENFKPPYPSFTARYKKTVNTIVMAYFGVQFKADRRPDAQEAIRALDLVLDEGNSPSYRDRALYIDEAGYETIVTVAYWRDPAEFDRWFVKGREAWTGADREASGLGHFTEIIRPAADGFETLFSSLGRPEGVGVVADEFSGEIQEHAYWGGMRDRLPRSRYDDLAASGTMAAEHDGPRTRVFANENLCLIRSGQDWLDTTDEERHMYLGDVEPVLREGMDFLRDDGREIGCYANRYMTVTGADGNPIPKSYGMSWWRGLADLERWAESHPTHVKIFGAAMKYLSTMGPAAKLRLYHEVTVARSGEQFFEYLNCHPETGLLRAVS